MSILTDGIRLARLKRSIGRDHSDPRPLTPIQVAKYLNEMKNRVPSERPQIPPCHEIQDGRPVDLSMHQSIALLFDDQGLPAEKN